MKKILLMIAIVAIYVSIFYLSQVVVVSVYMGAEMIMIFLKGGGSEELSRNISALGNETLKSTNLFYIFISIICLISFYPVLLISKQKYLDFCRFKKISLSKIAFIIPLGLAMYVLINYLMELFLQIPFLKEGMDEYEKLVEIMMSGNQFIAFIAIGFAAPFFEEIFVRGIIFNEMKKVMPITVALILQSALFAMLHFDGSQFIQVTYAFIVGIILGMVYYWTGSIWASIALHATFNLSNYILRIPQIFGFKELEFPGGYPAIVLIIASAVITILTMYYLFSKRQSKYYLT